MSSPHDASDARLLTHLNRPVYLLANRPVYSRSDMGARSTTSHKEPGSALVTGATSGIGRATSLRLARDGWRIVVHGRDARRGDEVVREIEREGGLARFVPADLKDVAAVRGLVKEAGGVDVLVNNAGSSWFGPTAGLDEATFDDLFDGNVRSAYFLVAGIATLLGQHHQPGQHGRPDRHGRRGRLRSNQGSAELHDAVLGGRVQPSGSPGRCHRRRPGVQRP